jgi:hypothetical protein
LGTSYFGNYRWYSGYGGGAYCDVNSNVTFIDCQISGNLAQGGMSGQGGVMGTGGRQNEPLVPYEIPSFGGGVYCAAGATVTFTGCTIANNISSPQVPVRFRLDPYLGHGGGVCAEDTANVVFNNCTFSENEASVGGGFNWADANPAISDCNFTFNTAFQGGGLFGQHGPGTIIGCNITNNTAVSDPNVQGELLGAGGGIHCWATDVNIVDCNISSNQAETSGGGVYFGGENYSSELINCLITDNLAGRDGGGVSVNWYSDSNIANCTIANNRVGGGGYGGGLYCSYDSYTNIIDSIIWNNIGINGSQLAVSTGSEYDSRPSTVGIFYSDVGIRAVKYELIDANGLPTIRPGFSDNSLAANDDQSTGLVDIGFGIDFFGQAYSQLYVNNNGNVTFDANMVTFTPFGLTGNIGTPIIAPFFADVDTRPGAIPTNALTRYGTGTVDGHAAFGVTWIDVGYYNTHWDKLNSFQLVLIDRSDRGPGDFDIEFNYGKIQWETGDASSGVNGFGGSSAHVGFSNGTGDPGTFYEFEGSGVSRSFLDSGPTGLIYGSRRSAVNGRYIFAVQSGLPELLPIIPIYVDVNCTLDGWDWKTNTNNWEPNFADYHNIDKDPLFVEGYFLSQIAAGQPVDSKCVDAGYTNAFNAGMYKHTTRTDLVVEDPCSPVDLGYHYVKRTEFVGDLNYDGIVDFADMHILSLNWLHQCDFPDWCDGADLNKDGIVNFKDEVILGDNWHKSEKTPPVPNPMTWEATPTSAPTKTYAEMTATKAKDAYGGTIQYYFQRTNASGVSDGFYRNWDPNRSFTNTGLTLNQTYGYRVKARDARHNETGWSVIGLVTVGKESPPSAPTNLTATAVSQTRINLTWTDTSNETGFKIERRTGAGSFTQIADTFAANVNTYSDTGLTAVTTYTYRVIAYNSGGNSPYSTEAFATTQGGGGGPPSGEPNQPIMIHSNIDPNCIQTKEFDPNTGKTYWYHTVVATVSDIGGGRTVWFRFVCNSQSVFSSPWISSAGPFPMYLQHPVSSAYPMVVVNVNGTTVTYRIMVKQGGASGYGMSWKVCASFNADGSNSSCSADLTIPWH